MLKHLDMTKRRLGAFLGNEQLRGRVYPRRQPVALAVYDAPGRIGHAEAMAGDYHSASVGRVLGPTWATHWVRVEISIPAAWAGEEVRLLFDAGCEGCIWEDGVPRQGLTGRDAGAGSYGRPEYPLTRAARGGERRTLYIELACNGLFGARHGHQARIYQAEVAVFDRRAWDLLLDFELLVGMAQHLPGDHPRAGQALLVANRIINEVDLDDPASFVAARDLAAEVLRLRNGEGQHAISAIGHAHIDTAWLWPLAETYRKCYRTFSTQLRHMEEFPDYRFVVSQACQWAFMKEQQPAIYEEMLMRAREGRFIPAGGTWVEPDCNIPRGESLVRQFLLGQRFFRRELGSYCREFWNPDVFGYCGQLPQLMRGAGIERFLTQKLSWNQFNKPTSHTFLWEGLDGSRVLTHFPPTDTYNANMEVSQVLYHSRNYKEHERSRESYMLYGHGDGGGGPTRDMIERLTRLADVDGLPRVASRAPEDFFARLEADLQDPVTWVGELYFELHRGTYTTQARNKWWNRRCEELLLETELWAALAQARGLASYPAGDLTRLWETLLLNQFHDIIPGSSITEVYHDSLAQYDELRARAETLRDQALHANAPAAPAGAAPPLLLTANPLAQARRAVAVLPHAPATPPAQLSASGEPLGVLSAPGMGWRVAPASEACEDRVTVTEDHGQIRLENTHLRAVLRHDGRLLSLVHRPSGRECLAPGCVANDFELFDDRPLNWDAWDVDVFHLEKQRPVAPAHTCRVLERGPLRAVLEFEYRVGKGSTLRQRVTLAALAVRLAFDCEMDWRERHQFLKVAFPLNLRAMDATYETQFGHLRRPTHFNTSWDMARFEVCAQRWADLSEPDFGVALLNNGKYGYACHGQVLRLSLLRAPTSPDPEADQGHQVFGYALLPHAGYCPAAAITAEAACFNQPLTARPGGDQAGEWGWFTLDQPNLVLETVKLAEDGGALILRLYEAGGTRGRAHLRVATPLSLAGATRCNLLEEQDSPLTVTPDGLALDYTPFQILTLKLPLG